MSTAAPGSYRDTGETVPDGGLVGIVSQPKRVYVDSPVPVEDLFVAPPLPSLGFPKGEGRTSVEITADPFSIPPIPISLKTFTYFVDPQINENSPVTELPLKVVGALPDALEQHTKEKFTAFLRNLPTVNNPDLVPVMYVRVPTGREAIEFYKQNPNLLSNAAISGEYQIVYKAGGTEYYRYGGEFSYPMSLGVRPYNPADEYEDSEVVQVVISVKPGGGGVS